MSPAPTRTNATPRPLGDAQLAVEVTGYGIASQPLGGLLDERTTLLVFLRHYG